MIPVVVNLAAAGVGRGTEDRIRAALDARGVAAELRPTRAERLAAAIRRLRDAGHPLIAVAGGDGTLRTAAQELIGTHAAIAPLPLGTLNHFARRVGIADLDAAADALARPRIERIAAGRVSGSVFLNTLTLGAYAGMVRRRDRLRAPIPKWGRATLAFAATVARLRVERLTLVSGGDERRLRTALVWIGVGCGSFPHPHRTPPALAAAELEIVVFRADSRAAVLGLALRSAAAALARRATRDHPRLEVSSATELRIRADRPLEATLDGEALKLSAEAVVEVRPCAVRVLMGRGSTSADRGEWGSDGFSFSRHGRANTLA